VTGDGVILTAIDEGRLFDGADLLSLPAPGPEATTAGRVDRAGNVAL
jgi:hypothetical protein